MALTRIDSFFLDLDAIGGITFDDQAGTPTLRVDATTHRVGIGTSAPTSLLDVNGNITISGSSRRIYGKFSGAPLSERTFFQGSVANNESSVGVIPNGTASQANFAVFNSSDPNNSGIGIFDILGNTLRVDATSSGTGVAPRVQIGVQGSGLTVVSGGNVGIGTTNPGDRLHVNRGVLISDGTDVSLMLSRTNTERAVQHFYVSALNSPWYTYGENLTWSGERSGTTRRGEKPYYEAYGPAVGRKEFGFVNKTSADTSFTNGDLVPSMVLKNNGNIGIGTTDPASLLHLFASGGSTGEIRLQSSDGKTYAVGSTGSGYGSTNKFIIYDITAGAERLCVNSGGNVGIANTSPSYRLSLGQNTDLKQTSIYLQPQNVAGVDNEQRISNGIGSSIYSSVVLGFNNLGGGPADSSYIALRTAAGANSTIQTTGEYGVERVRISNTGNVGIGTTNPTGKLSVFDAAPGTSSTRDFLLWSDGTRTGLISHTGATYSYAGVGGNELWYYSNSTYSAITLGSDGGVPIKFVSGGLERLRIAANGLVGIGTASPSSLLSLAGGTSTIFGVHLEPAGWNGLKHRFVVPVSGDTSILSCNWNGSAVDNALQATSAITVGNGVISLSTGTVNTAPTSRVFINSAGNVGVNTLTPLLRFHVNSSSLLATNSSVDPDSFPLSVLAGNITHGGWGATGIGGNMGTGDSWALAHNGSYLFLGLGDGVSTGTLATTMRWDPTGEHRFFTRGTERITLSSTGNVGIGTTSPGATLHVSNYGAGGTCFYVGGSTRNFQILEQTGTRSFQDVRIRFDDNSINAPIKLFNNYSGAGFGTGINFYGFNDVNNANIYTVQDAAGSAAARLQITTTSGAGISLSSTGNVGIGTTNPSSSYVLTTNGSIFTNGCLLANGVVSDARGGGGLYISGGGGSPVSGRITIGDGTGWKTFITSKINSVNTDLVTFQDDGNVGIGTTSPVARLDVRLGGGGIIAQFHGSPGRYLYTGTDPSGHYIEAQGTQPSERVLRFQAFDGTSGYAQLFIDGANKYVTTSSNVNVGIGTAAPSHKLQVQGAIATTNGLLLRTNGSNTVGTSGRASISFGEGGWITGSSASFLLEFDGENLSNEYNALCFRSSVGPADIVRMNLSGEVWIGYTSSNGASYKLQVNSQIFATSATIATSDGRYKENVETLTGGLDLIKALRPVSFTWKPQQDILGPGPNGDSIVLREAHNFPEGYQVGFIAQEVQQAISSKPWAGSIIKENKRPAVLSSNGEEIAPEEEFYGIAEGNMVAILTSALKEAISRIEELEQRVRSLEES